MERVWRAWVREVMTDDWREDNGRRRWFVFGWGRGIVGTWTLERETQ